MPKAVKCHTIADLLAQFLGEEEFLLDDEVPREVATIEITADQWVMKFDGSSTTNLRGTRVVFYHRNKENITLSFKLEFLSLNNTAEY